MRRVLIAVVVAVASMGFGPASAMAAGQPELPGVALPPSPAAQPSVVDPGVRGRYATVTGEYSLAAVRLSGLPAPVEMRAVVVAPRHATGRRPLVLLLHGRHPTCFRGLGMEWVNGEWPCPSGTTPIPSHRGYLHVQQLLASQGYVTVSIAANGVNAQDRLPSDLGAEARSALVRRHLARWADWAGGGRSRAPSIVRRAPRADMTKVLLMGHSRGGEGVNRAAMDSLTRPPRTLDGYGGPVRWRIRGTVLVAPTAAGQNPVADVPSVVLFGSCDGDTADLQGQVYVDGTRGVGHGTALHSAVYVLGANHNFFNSEWTPGLSVAPARDDSSGTGIDSDPVCRPGSRLRLSSGKQQAVESTYIAAAARLFLAGDDRVRPLLDGAAVRAPSVGTAVVLSHAVGGNRIPVVVPDARLHVGGAGRLCAEYSDRSSNACVTPSEESWASVPHFVPFRPLSAEAGRRAVVMSWSAPGKAVSLRPPRPVWTGAAQQLAMRIVVSPDTRARFAVAIVDQHGRRTSLGDVRVDALPQPAVTSSGWAREVRVRLPRPSMVARLELLPRTRTGRAWLIDAWAWRPGSPDPAVGPMPRVDVRSVIVAEGDSGTRTRSIPVTVTGGGTGQVRLYLGELEHAARPGEGEPSGALVRFRSWVVTVHPGVTAIDVPVSVRGDVRHNGDMRRVLVAKALHGVFVGSYRGELIVRDDDPR